MITYRHTQVGWAVIIPILGIVGAMGIMAALFREVLQVLPWMALATATLLPLFATLTVTVGDGWVRCRFGAGLIWRRIRLSDVRRAATVRNRWWYGWGIRLTPHGWLWNVSGLDAVELTFASGKRFRIGSDDTEKLLGAIRASTMQTGSSH